MATVQKIKVLIIVTSHDKLGDTNKKTGFYYEELATPYWCFMDAGYQVDIASIQGGKAPVDPGSINNTNSLPESVKRFLSDSNCINKIEKTIKVSTIDPGQYTAIFLAGGHGTMWDFAQSNDLAMLVSRGYQKGAIIGAVCHGAAGLLNAKASNGTPLIAGRKINGFTAAEEIAVGLNEVVPFILESELKKQGATFEKTENFQAYSVVDDRIVTGQNPASSKLVADQIIKMIQGN